MTKITRNECGGCQLLIMCGDEWVCARDRVDSPECEFPHIRQSNINRQLLSSQPDTPRVQVSMFPEVRTARHFSDVDYEE